MELRFSVESNKNRIGSYLFYLEKSHEPMRIQQKVALNEKNCKWKTSWIGQTKGSRVVHLSADPNVGSFKG